MNIEKNYLKNSLFYPVTFICMISFLLCFFSVKISVLIGIALAFWIIMRAKPDALLGLLLLYFMRYHFYYTGADSSGNTPEMFRQVLSFAGFPLEVETLACFFIALRVVMEVFLNPETFRNKFPLAIFYLWLLAFLPVLTGLYYQLGIRSFNWTGGIRYLMITGSYFYGYILAENWPKGENKFLLYLLLPLVSVMLLLMNLHWFWSHHGFLFLGLGGAFSVYLLSRKRAYMFGAGIFLSVLCIRCALSMTITIMLIVLLAVFLTCISIIETKFISGIRDNIVKLAGIVVVLGAFVFTLYIIYYGLNSDYDPTAMYGTYDGTFIERLEAKLFSDRLPLWIAAARQILNEPEFLIPSVRYLEVPGHNNVWMVSCHNSILEALRVNGLFSGTIMLIIIFFALKNSVKILRESKDAVLKSVTAGVLGTAVVGIMTGNFPINMTVGFWIWALLALCHGIFLKDTEPLDLPAKEKGGETG